MLPRPPLRPVLLAGLVAMLSLACQSTARPGPPALLCGGSSGRECQLTLFAVQPDDGVGPLVERFGSARSSIDYVPFMLDEPRLLDALKAARARGVTVRVLLEPAPSGRPGFANRASDWLRGAGVEVRIANPAFALTHAKYAVVDGSRALILTHNSDSAELTTRRDFALEDADPADARFVQSLFEADWNRTQLGPIPPGFAVSPDNSNAELVALIASSQHSLELYAQRLLASPILDALREAARRGVTVRVLAAPLSAREAALDQLLPLIRDRRLQVRMPRAPEIHAKLLIVDGTSAFLGSENVEDGPAERRRELGVVFADPTVLGRLTATFERDWAAPAGTLGGR